MTPPHETEFERAVRTWEETGRLPEGEGPEAALLRRTLLAIELLSASPSESDIDDVLCQLPGLVAPKTTLADRVQGMLAGVLEEVRAVLRTDLIAPQPAFRSGSTVAPSIYETPRYTVTISVGLESIRGTVLPRESDEIPAGGRAVLATRGERVAVDLDAHGGFHFEELEFDHGTIEIEIGGQQILLGDVSGPTL
ncbi:MAG: hypothetical protein R3E97_03780 [Candidatus Eisenbacteria bacterium]